MMSGIAGDGERNHPACRLKAKENCMLLNIFPLYAMMRFDNMDFAAGNMSYRKKMTKRTGLWNRIDSLRKVIHPTTTNLKKEILSFIIKTSFP